MKWLRLILVGCLIGLGASTLIKLFSANDISGCNVTYRHDTRIKVGSGSYIDAEVPESTQQKEVGLGGRSCIGAEQGMLFVFNKQDQYDFWMKNMKFPIDIIWINENKVAIDITSNISPATYPKTFTSKQTARYVLEIQSGKAQQLNISEGTHLKFNL
jgi:uncharacterized membrane protein (UPF0127 family)